jgi:hypothetical protein
MRLRIRSPLTWGGMLRARASSSSSCTAGSGPVTEAHYHGVYMLVERIKWDDNRVNIAKLTPDDNSEPEISGGYILNFESGREWHIESTGRRTRFALVRPQVEDVTVSRHTGSRIISVISNPPSSAPTSAIPKPAMRRTSIRSRSSTTISSRRRFKEMDGYRLSTFMHKDRGGRMVMGPVWDYNLSLGNYMTSGGWNGHDPTGWYYTYVPEESYLNGWYNRLFRDPDFLRERYRATLVGASAWEPSQRITSST